MLPVVALWYDCHFSTSALICMDWWHLTVPFVNGHVIVYETLWLTGLPSGMVIPVPRVNRIDLGFRRSCHIVFERYLSLHLCYMSSKKSALHLAALSVFARPVLHCPMCILGVFFIQIKQHKQCKREDETCRDLLTVTANNIHNRLRYTPFHTYSKSWPVANKVEQRFSSVI